MSIVIQCLDNLFPTHVALLVNTFLDLTAIGSPSVEAAGADPERDRATGEEAKKKKKKKKKAGAAERDEFLHPTSNPTGTGLKV